MTALADRTCTLGATRLDQTAANALLAELGNDWQLASERLTKTFSFDDFVSALAYVNKLGELAEAENHHPDITLSWGKVGVSIWTHDAGGITENDFIWCAKAQRLND